jgi:hypothetical protein
MSSVLHLPRISYNGMNLDFPEHLDGDGFLVDYPFEGQYRLGVSGKGEEIITRRVDTRVRIKATRLRDQTFRRELENWWEWARTGQPWTFALDPSKTFQTTIATTASTGTNRLRLSTVRSLEIGDVYFIRNAAYQHELVRVVSIDPSVNDVFLERRLNFNYELGDIFRFIHFFNGQVRDRNAYPIFDRPEATSDNGSPWRWRYDFVLELFEAL